MIRLYCRLKEGNRDTCPGCENLARYAESRLRIVLSAIRKEDAANAGYIVTVRV